MSTPDTATPPASPAAPAITEDKTVAIIGYFTGIGWLIATILHGKQPTAFSAFHLRQMFGLSTSLSLSGVFMVIPFLGWILSGSLVLAHIVLWFIALIGAINGEKKPVPILGPIYQDLFKGVFING